MFCNKMKDKIMATTKKANSPFLRIAFSIIAALAIALACEILFFNYQSLLTIFNTNDSISIDGQKYEGQIISADFRETNSARINVSGAVSTLTICTGDDSEITFRISIQDEGNQLPYQLGDITVSNAKTVSINPQGLVSSMIIESENNSGIADNIDLIFNQPISFDISKSRIVSIALLCMLGFLISKSSPLSTQPYNKGAAFYVALFICCAIPFSTLCALSAVPSDTIGYEHHHQYYEMAEALASGHVYLSAQPASDLLSITNPYDTALRASSNISYLWDHAFYNGKYYMYFGVLPAIVYYLPYYLITSGGELPNWIATSTSCLLFIGGLIYFVYNCCKKWFPHVSQAAFLMAYSTLLQGSWIIYDALSPDLYSEPITLGLACSIWGIALIIRSIQDSKISIATSCLGSFLLACTMLCRPQLLIFGLIAIVIAAKHITQNKEILKDNVRALLLACLPVLLIAGVTGAYNTLRFGSPFDFGANYNLTTNDMTHRGWNFNRLPLALYAYLIEPPAFSISTFGFLPVNLDSNYLGTTISQDMYGGLLTLTPILLLTFIVHFTKPRNYSAKIQPPSIVILLLCAIGIAAFDANGAGILMRYFNDFGLLLSIAACFELLAFSDKSTVLADAKNPDLYSQNYVVLHRCFIIAILISALNQLLIILS